MAVKYTIPYLSIDDTPWRVDLITDAYEGDPINVRGYGDNACIIEWNGGVDDPFDNPIVSSRARIQLLNEGQVDMDELQLSSDRDFVVEVYHNNELKWKGYLVTDNIQQPLLSTPYTVQLTAIDGLNMLEGITYTHANLLTSDYGIANRSPLNFLRQCLFASANLGLMLPIRWCVGLESVTTQDDPIAGMMTWSPYGDGFIDGYYDENGTPSPIYKDCRYIVEGLVKAFGCRIFQADGAWHVMRTNDIISGSFTYNECNATLDIPIITQHAANINRLVKGSKEVGGDYSFVREDALITVKPALGKVDVTYDANRRENVLPNGGMDQWVYSFPNPLMYWGFTDNPNTDASYTEHDSLTDQPGSAVQLTNTESATEDAEFTFEGGLPIDANLLFKRMTFGFTFMPTQFGFQLDESGNIDWSANPLKISVRYVLPFTGDEGNFYLNENGYWQNAARGGGELGVTFLRRETSIIAAGILGHELIFQGSPNIGDEIIVSIKSSPTGSYQDFSFVVGALEENNLALALQGASDAITNPNVSVQSIVMDSATQGRIRIQMFQTYGNPLGSTRKSGAIQDYEYIFIKPELNKPTHPNDILSFVFRGNAGNTEILIPDPGSLNGVSGPAVGKLSVRFYIKPGQQYVLDEIWVRIEDNNDVYRAISDGEGKSQSISLDISSSFSGFMISNLMRSYHQSNEDFLWTDGAVTASLTEHYARAAMRWRYKPSAIFNGTISTRTKDWSLFEIYGFSGLDGRKFLPLNATYNTEKCEVTLVAMEGRDDGVITKVEHYASNNMPLSNYGGN